VRERLLSCLIALALVGVAGCAPKMTPQQALVEEAFNACRAQGPSTQLERVDRDGRFSVVGREPESQRVHDCMVRHAQPTRPLGAAPAKPEPKPEAVSKPETVSASRPETVSASRLPGTWRGTLTLPPQTTGQPEVASATVRFAVSAGALRWSMASNSSARLLAADGTALVVDGELRMMGTMRAVRPTGEPTRSSITVRYAGAMVGDRLEVTGVTTDKQVHVLSVRRVSE
jgi:hypothetical protein